MAPVKPPPHPVEALGEGDRASDGAPASDAASGEAPESVAALDVASASVLAELESHPSDPPPKHLLPHRIPAGRIVDDELRVELEAV
jgi:hypothetical protein